METCSLCEAPPEPGEELCKYHLLQKQERRAGMVEKIWGVAKGAAGIVALVLAIIGMYKARGGDGDSSKS